MCDPDPVEPQRTCIGCRSRDDQSALVRIVRVENALVDGTKPRIPGRGAYVHLGCVELATKRQAWRRAFGAGSTLSIETG